MGAEGRKRGRERDPTSIGEHTEVLWGIQYRGSRFGFGCWIGTRDLDTVTERRPQTPAYRVPVLSTW